MRKRVASSGRNGRCGVGRRSRTATARSRHSWRHSRSGTPAQGSHDLENYDTALATVQVGRADGISFILTPEDPFAAIDLDHCRELDTQSGRLGGDKNFPFLRPCISASGFARLPQ